MILREWQRSLTRLIFINLFSFLLASWLYAHGTALSAEQKFVNISTLHLYFLPQLIILIIGIIIFRLRKCGEVEQDVVVRKEPTWDAPKPDEAAVTMNRQELYLCVPKTSSVLIGGGNRLTSAHNDRAAMFCPYRLGFAI
jgi:hypothetical protein